MNYPEILFQAATKQYEQEELQRIADELSKMAARHECCFVDSTQESVMAVPLMFDKNSDQVFRFTIIKDRTIKKEHKMNNVIYNTAVMAVKDKVEKTQAELDAASIKARQECIADLRAKVLNVPIDNPSYPFCALVADTITVGRSDGYPNVTVPKEVTELLGKAVQAKILKLNERGHVQLGGLQWCIKFEGIINFPDSWNADYEAWKKADDYRRANAK